MSKDQKFKTQKGYDFFEVSSSFQKCVRRGLEDEALYWGYELFQSRYEKYLWKRILIITCEDVGLADPEAPARIKALHDSFFELRKNYKVDGDEVFLQLGQAIMYLCRSPKSRLTDWTKNWCIWRHNTVNLEIPDFALDVHTRKGKIKGRGLKFFYDEGSKVSPHLELEKEKERAEWWYDFHCVKSKKERESLSDKTQVVSEGDTLQLFNDEPTQRKEKVTGKWLDH